MSELKSDIRMYHEMKEQAKKMAELFAFHEMKLYMKCIFYVYDSQACEETCHCERINRQGKDFCAEKECWLCKHYKIWKQ